MTQFPSANATFNPSRFAAETGQMPSEVPGSSVLAPSTSHSLLTRYLPILVLVVLLWCLEKRRIKALAR